MIVSDAEPSQGSASSQSDDQGFNPTDKQLLEKYEKYPDYLKLSFKKALKFYSLKDTFNKANEFVLQKVLSKKSKDTIMERAFPITLYIQLVPELNALTIQLASQSELTTTDSLLTDLLVNHDQGTQLMIEELSSI